MKKTIVVVTLIMTLIIAAPVSSYAIDTGSNEIKIEAQGKPAEDLAAGSEVDVLDDESQKVLLPPDLLESTEAVEAKEATDPSIILEYSDDIESSEPTDSSNSNNLEVNQDYLDFLSETINNALNPSTSSTLHPTGYGSIGNLKDGDTVHFDRTIQTNSWYYKNDKYYAEGYKDSRSVWGHDFVAQIQVTDVNYFKKAARSSNDEVVYISDGGEAGDRFIQLTRSGGGECDIYYWDQDGIKHTIHVIVDPTPFKFKNKVLDSSHSNNYVYNDYDGFDSQILSAKVVSGKSIVKVYCYPDGFYILPKKAGSATIRVYPYDGQAQIFSVTVKKGYFKRCIQKNVGFDVNHAKKYTGFTIWGAPIGSKVSLKVGGKTYKYTTKDGSYDYYKIKKAIKKGTKYTVTIKHSGYKKTFKGKVV